MSVCVGRVLVIEDEPLLRISIRDALQKEGWTVDIAEDGVQGIALFERFLHEFVLTDLVMPRIGGMEVLRRVKLIQPATTVVIITAHGTVEKAVEAMREGAVDFFTKPFSMAQLFVRLSNICTFRRLSEQNVRLQEQLEAKYSFSNIIGRSKAMQEVFELIRVIADSDASVLIQGESGTGKELVASAIHYNSPRRARPYIRVSCASLPESLIESELFGYERGAFTGASERRIGRFEAANGGTLFLDEIGELPLTFQIKLLRVLQEHQIERLGSNKAIDVDVRIVAASLRPLEEEIAEGQFRQDLFFRINTATIQLAPLRDRREDISLLAQVFLREFAEKRGKDVEGFSDEVMEAFDAYDWPGNVRELRNAVERALLFCRSPQVTIADLPTNFDDLKSLRTTRSAGDVVKLHEAVVRAEISAIRDALSATGGRRTKAADLLGVSRKTLWEKAKAYGLDAG
ncbi:MAG: sigma-54-dependent Fis family transcriptional regulator [Acidobacteria bacterium]|nr:MAG: sigma-54-dependent Fis family transcriptional regulator [Acidobacteriota bacterium]